MELAVLLSKVFGVYFLIASAMVFLNRKALMVSVESMFKERFAQMLAAMIALLGGLTFVNLYQDWSSLPSGILSAIGWLILIKGLLYAFMPEVRLASLTKILSEHSWYIMDGVLAFIVGLYLTGYGYGFW